MSTDFANRKIRWGLVGCGRIAKNHFSALKEFSERVDLIAVCDIKEDRVQAAANDQGAKPYTTIEEMLASEKLDIVSLCTPSGIHPEHTILAAQKGVHVLTEKPMGTRLEHGQKMIAACDEANVNLYVVKQNRMNPTIQKLREAIDNNRFGEIYFAQVNVFWTRPQDYYDQAPWRGTRELDGGALMNQASHYVDLLTWLVGPVKEVKAFTGTLARKIEMEDTAAVSLKWPNGGMGSINVTMLTYPKNLEGSLTILGEKGSVKIGGIAINEIQAWDFEDGLDSKDDVSSLSYKTDSVYGFGHPIFYKNVINHLSGVRSILCDGNQGLQSLELLEAIYRSSDENKTIQLPLEV